MKIVIIGTIYPYRGGLAAYNERLARQLKKEGHQVRVHNFKLQYPSILFPGKTQYDPEEREVNLKTERSINSINPINWWITGNKIRRENADLVIVKFWLPFMGPAFGTILRQIKKNKHSKVISILDNIIPHKDRIGDEVFTKYFIKPVDGFIAMSKNVLDDLNNFDTKKPKKFSPHPIFDNFGKKIPQTEALDYLKLDPKFKYVLFFGLIRDYKGLDLIIKAFGVSELKNSKIKLLIAGEVYSDERKYYDLIKKHGLSKNIIFHNKFIPDSEVKYYFSASNLVAQPYKTATQSGVTQIAYHFEKPMIVTDVGGLSELCPDEKVGFVTEVNPKAIANAISKFFQDESTEGYMTNQIQEEKKKYSWNILAANIFLLLEEIRQNE